MHDLREMLQGLVALAPSREAGFDDELWERIQVTERAAARRRRVWSLFAAAIAIAAASSTAVFAFGRNGERIVDQTYSCRLENVGGVNQFFAIVTVRSSQVVFEAGSGASVILSNSNRKKKDTLFVDSAHCQEVHQSIPLARAGVPLRVRLRATPGAPEVGDRFFCWVGRALFRVQVSFNSSGVATKTLVAIRNARTAKPIAFVQEVPPFYTLFSAAACRH